MTAAINRSNQALMVPALAPGGQVVSTASHHHPCRHAEWRDLSDRQG